MNRREFLCGLTCAGVAGIAACSKIQNGERLAVKPEDFSFCGLDCLACDVYKATLHGDQEARQRAAKKWEKTAKEHWKMDTLDPMILDCHGCRSGMPAHGGESYCPIRLCAQKQGFVSCGQCAKWETCETLAGLLTDEPTARPNLRKISLSTIYPGY